MTALPSARAALPELDPTDPYAREAQTFPRLGSEERARVANYGIEQGLRKSAVLFQRCQRSVDFFVVLEGSIEIVDLDRDGLPVVLATTVKANSRASSIYSTTDRFLFRGGPG
ncbi:MAG: hypothetical protein M3P99_05110 [Pseudomonadota bacterium]|nr:hypothetical protein [Pseudomonadota bacterium]